MTGSPQPVKPESRDAHVDNLKQYVLTNGMPLREKVASGFMERYSRVIGVAIEHIPDDSIDTPRLLDMKESLGV